MVKAEAEADPKAEAWTGASSLRGLSPRPFAQDLALFKRP
jgi:hypothetical protein